MKSFSTGIKRRRRNRSRRKLLSRKSRAIGLTSTRSVTRCRRRTHLGSLPVPGAPITLGASRIRAPVSDNAAAKRSPSHSSRVAGRPLLSHSRAASSTVPRARRPTALAVIARASGGQLDKNASCATDRYVLVSSRSVITKRSATNASNSAATDSGMSARATRCLVGQPFSSTLTSRSNESMISSADLPLDARASSSAALACWINAPFTPPASR